MSVRWLITVRVISLAATTSTLISCAQIGTQPSLTIVPGSELPTATSGSINRLENSAIGFSLLYPADWHVGGPILATEFAKGAQCESVEVVDGRAPPDSASGSSLSHSFVQICAKSLTDGLPLDQFLSRTYGETDSAQFQRIELSGVTAYQSTNANRDRVIFAQTHAYRLQIAAAVVASPDNWDQRRLQVEKILASFSFQ